MTTPPYLVVIDPPRVSMHSWHADEHRWHPTMRGDVAKIRSAFGSVQADANVILVEGTVVTVVPAHQVVTRFREMMQ